MPDKIESYKYMISVIIPIYNTEQYLKESLDSIINQTIGFEKNIQLILINDGSIDACETICLEYQEKYPDNIIYKYQKNAGVASASNEGLKYVEGKYVNIFGSDDRWDKNAFKRSISFFEKKYDEIDLIVSRIKFFGRKQESTHPLDFRFVDMKNNCEVVDINKKPDYVQMTGGNLFYKTDAIKGKKFNEKLKVAEDAFFITPLILGKQKYGIVKNCISWYRKRENLSSLCDVEKKSKIYYIDNSKILFEGFINMSKKMYKDVVPYIQQLLMYELKWRIMSDYELSLNKTEILEFKKIVKNVLNYIDDDVIYRERKLAFPYNILLLNVKYSKDILKEVCIKDEAICYNDTKIILFNKGYRIKIKTLDLNGSILKLSASTQYTALKEKYNLYMKDDKGKLYSLNYKMCENGAIFDLDGKELFRPSYFEVEVDIKNIKSLSFILEDKKTKKQYMIKHRYDKYCNTKINNEIRGSYYTNGKYILSPTKKIIYIKKYNKSSHLKKEFIFICSLLKHLKINIISYRLLYRIFNKTINKKIWLVSDRYMKSGDNGEAFFKYAMKKNNNERKIFFLFDKTNPDYKRLMKIGPILNPYSIKYKLSFLLSDKIISSHFDREVTNVFDNNKIFIQDLYNFDYIYLTHGVMPGNLSEALNKYKKNIKLFITSSKKEYNSLLTNEWGYTKKDIVLTGMSRWDVLKSKPKKIIIFLPTWRSNLAGTLIYKKRDREYNKEFKNTDYFKFYNSLINDKKILETMKKYNYKGEFCVHPSFYKQYKDFEGNKYISIGENIADYNKLLSEASLLVSDYSSVIFDFAYLKKVIVYSQFDSSTYWGNHFYEKGYFDYEKNGFGPVCSDYNTIVETIIKYIENDCKIEKKYLKRVNDFYEYFDTNNTKRIYDEIIKFDKQKEV